MRECRRSKRFNIAMNAAYMRAQGATSIRSSLTITENISLSGLCARIEKAVCKGDKIMAELTLAPNQGLLVMATVKWVSEDKASGINRCGLEFQWVSSKSLLGDYVAMASEVDEKNGDSPTWTTT